MQGTVAGARLRNTHEGTDWAVYHIPDDPARELRGFHYYRSPFAEPPKLPVNAAQLHHTDWYHYRREFEKHGTQVSYDLMLREVTKDNPPFSPELEGSPLFASLDSSSDVWMADMPVATREWTFIDVAAMVLAASASLLFAGVFGGLSALAATLIVILIVAWVVH